VAASDIVVVPHGTEPRRPSDGSAAEAKSSLGLPQDGSLLLTSGFIGPNKGIEYSLRAVELLMLRHPRLVYAIVGQAHPDDVIAQAYVRDLTELIASTPNSDRVLWIDRYVTDSELSLWSVAADVCVLPYVEPYQVSSGVLTRYLGMGRAIVSTDFPYASEVLALGAGCLVPMRDEQALFSCIDKLLGDPGSVARLQEAAYAAGQRMAWTGVARVTAQIVRDAVRGRHP
jgi:glycosyltransferase involved in cell wall biosynthesis